MPDSPLFNGFPKISSEEWKNKIRQDLKGADYDDTLIWNAPEGVAVQPFYHGDHGLSRQIGKGNSGWSAGHLISITEDKEARANALYAFERGAESIWFVLASDPIDFESLLAGMDLDNTSVHFELRHPSYGLIDSIAKFRKTSDSKLRVHVDPIGNLLRTGNWIVDQEKDLQRLADFQNALRDTVVTVDASIYQNAGANMVQELAYALAHANEYLNLIANRAAESANFTFTVSVGTNYFFEIAKLRALRWLWAILAAEYEISEDCFIRATPTKRNKTLYDYNVNMLRTTTECMSAILGGADLICNYPYDSIYHKPNEFGDRIALNQLLLLKNESHFDKVENAAEGSYYVESLTRDLAEKALVLFKEIEASGGFLKQLYRGIVQDEIDKSAASGQGRFERAEDVLIGANKFENKSDTMKAALEIDPFKGNEVKETAVRPLIEKRLAEDLEKKRLGDE